MPDFSAERALLIFLLLNAAVFGSAFFFSRRRLKTNGSQTGLDAFLLGFLIQYLSVGIPGVMGFLRPSVIAGIAIALSAILFLFSLKPKPALPSTLRLRAEGRYSERPDRATRLALTAIATFVLGFLGIYIYEQAHLPVMSNDAITYHFPAAAQWLRHGRIDLFQTWFFNPANTYSPLAGSMFIVWLMAPFHSVVMARFVEVPPLLGIGLGIYQLCRQIAPMQSRITCTLLAAMAVFARPIFLPSMMGKDDLFVAFFFLAAVNTLTRDTGLRPVLIGSEDQMLSTTDAASTGRRPVSRGMIDAIRCGIAIGLMLATKYTALLCVPVLLLAIGKGWRVRQWLLCVITLAAIAGPWYLRNGIGTGNPIFPLAIDHLARGLFTTARSEAFVSWRSGFNVAIGGEYGLPLSIATVLAMAWLLNWIMLGRQILTDPLRRMCIIGPVIGIALFYWRSPFPEVRFLLPFFLLLMVPLAAVIPRGRGGAVVASLLLLCTLATLSDLRQVTLWFAVVSVGVAAAVTALLWWSRESRVRKSIVFTIFAMSCGTFTYINWTAYSQNFSDDSAYALEYPPGLTELWRFVNQKLPSHARIAYTNLYLIFPMQQGDMDREFFYAPTRPGVKAIADLGWLGDHLSGEALVKNAAAATFSKADRSTWIENLTSAKAQYIVIGRGGTEPPEADFVRNSASFQMLFTGEGGEVWKFNPLQ